MKLLIDTNAALWLFNEHEKLTTAARECLRNEENRLHISIVSAWEVAIKHSLGKLTGFPGGVKLLLSAISENSIEIVAILPEYVERVEELAFIHSDPFDRLIVATALCEDMAIVTADENIRKYGAKCIW